MMLVTLEFVELSGQLDHVLDVLESVVLVVQLVLDHSQLLVVFVLVLEQVLQLDVGKNYFQAWDLAELGLLV